MRTQRALIVRVRPKKKEPCLCAVCGSSAKRRDEDPVLRRWRGPNIGGAVTYVEAKQSQVECEEHGLVPAAVCWAEYDSRCTKTFTETLDRAFARVPKEVVSVLCRVPREHKEKT